MILAALILIFAVFAVSCNSDKQYALEQIDGIWYAKEYSGIILPGYLLPEGLDYSNFEYDVQKEAYVQKNIDVPEYVVAE